MFNKSVENQIQEAICKQIGIELSAEDIHKMRIVPDVESRSKMLILCLQKGRETILVPVKVSDDGQKLIIDEIKRVLW